MGMNKSYFYFIIFYLLFVCLTISSTAERIYGGKFANIVEAPYTVYIQKLNAAGEEDDRCTGAIIDEDWVLTAANCLQPNDVSKYVIHAGIDDLEATTNMQTRRPVKMVYHPMFRRYAPLKKNLALIKVSRFNLTSNNVGVLQLGNETWPKRSYRTCTNIGWGIPDFFTKNNTRLHYSEVTAEHGSRSCSCLHAYQKKSVICLKQAQEKGVCAGDAGGPLVCDGKGYGIASHFYDPAKCSLFGLLRRSVNCTAESAVAVYTYTCSELNWLRRHVKSLPRRPLSCTASCLFNSHQFLMVVITQIIIVAINR